MFNVSGGEIIVILLLALVVLGPEKLPEALRRAGRTYAELKKMGNSFQSEMRSVLDEPMREMRDTADLLRKAVDITVDTATTDTRKPKPAPAPADEPVPEVAAAEAEVAEIEAEVAADAEITELEAEHTPDPAPAPDPVPAADLAPDPDPAPVAAPNTVSMDDHVADETMQGNGVHHDAGGNGTAPVAEATQLSPEDDLINRTLSGDS